MTVIMMMISRDYLKKKMQLALVLLLVSHLPSICECQDSISKSISNYSVSTNASSTNITTNTNTTSKNIEKIVLSDIDMEVERGVTEVTSILFTTTISPSFEVEIEESNDLGLVTVRPNAYDEVNSGSSSDSDSESNSQSDSEAAASSDSDTFEEIKLNFLGDGKSNKKNNSNESDELSALDRFDNTIPGYELHNWKSPPRFRKEYPYFLSGFDDQNRPIFVSTWGTFDMRKIVYEGIESMDSFEKYAKQAGYNIIRAHKLRSTPDNPVAEASFIIDFDKLKLEQLSSIRVISFGLKLARDNRDIIEKFTHKVVIINANYIAETAINLARPILGNVMNRVEVFGTNKSKWLPHLLRIFPAKSLPPQYGGPQDHKVIRWFP